MPKFDVLLNLNYGGTIHAVGAVVEGELEQFEQLVAQGVLRLQGTKPPAAPSEPAKPADTWAASPEALKQPQEPSAEPKTVEIPQEPRNAPTDENVQPGAAPAVEPPEPPAPPEDLGSNL